MNSWETNRRDQSIAGISTLLAHVFLILLLSHNTGSGQGDYNGNNTGRGDAFTVYPLLLAPYRVKAPSIPLNLNPRPTAATSQPQPDASTPPHIAPSPSPNIARPINQADLNTYASTPQSKEPLISAQTALATARNAPSTSSGGSVGHDLLSSYQAAIRAAIYKKWQSLSSHIYPGGCTIHLSQNPGGIVTATSAKACELSREDQLQLEAAALMAQPMPYIGYESVFAQEMDLTL